MSFTDNFGHPRGLLGRLMLVTMEKEHLPMAKWAFNLFEVPQTGTIVDLGCGGGSFVIINNYGSPDIDWEKKVPCMTRYTAEEIKVLLERAGFCNVSVEKNGTLFCVAGKVPA